MTQPLIHLGERVIAEPIAFPDELRSLNQWICWRRELKHGRSTKIPYDAKTGRRASSTNPSTWTTYVGALARADEFDGIGFVFRRGGGITGIDIDGCINDQGVIDDEAGAIVDEFATYTELSPSGHGVHLFVRGSLPPGKRRRGRYEIYDEGRYFTVTGQRVDGTSALVAERQGVIERFHQWLSQSSNTTPEPEPATRAPVSLVQTVDDTGIVDRAHRAKNGGAFGALWRGDTRAYDGDESRADMALCGMLAFWVGNDEARIDRLFRQSGLWRQKWDERRGETTYGGWTIANVLASPRETYTPSADLGRVVWRGEQKIDPTSGEILEAEARFTIHWQDEALEPQPPVEWTVENIASPGTVALIVGAGGTMKTYLTLDMLVHVAQGIDWLGHKVTRGNVLIIDEESGPRRLKRRLSEVMRQHGMGRGRELAYVSLQGLNLRDESDIVSLETMLVEVTPSLILIDALADVMPGADENAVADTQPAFLVLRQLADRFSCTFIVIHHSNKVGGYRGSTAIQASVDLMLMVERIKGSQAVTVATAKTRDVEPFSLTAHPHFEFDGAAQTFDLERVEGGMIPQPQPKFGATKALIVRHLLAHGKGSKADIERLHPDVSGEAIQKSLYRLMKDDVIKRDPESPKSGAIVYLPVDFDNLETLMRMIEE